MPIRPENKARYPKNWKQIREQILARSGHSCEGSPAYPHCRVPNYSYRNNTTGEVTTETDIIEVWKLADGNKVSRIVLTIAHLDHIHENCDPANLRAWCQRCHLKYDAAHHAVNSAKTRRDKLNNFNLDLGINL